jgi:hypothetical protein
MPNESEAPTSQEPAAQAGSSDAKKSGNVSVGQATHALLKREAAKATGDTPTESIAKEAQKAPENAQTSVQPEETQKTPPEQKTEPEDKAKAEPKDSDDDLSKIPPEVQAAIDKRIGKALEKQRLAEQKAAEAEAKLLQQQAAAKEVPTPDNPLANIVSIDDLKEQRKVALETKKWAQDVLDSDAAESGVDVNGKKYTKADLKRAIR